jgi:hypothetical protein
MDREKFLRARSKARDNHSGVRVTEGPHLEFVCIGLEGLNEVICVALFGVANAEVIDHEGEHDVAGDMSEQARCVSTLDIAMGAEVPDETGLA